MQNRFQFLNSLQVNKKPTYGRNKSCNLFTWNCEIDINRFDANANNLTPYGKQHVLLFRLKLAAVEISQNQKDIWIKNIYSYICIYLYKCICDAMSSRCPRCCCCCHLSNIFIPLFKRS